MATDKSKKEIDSGDNTGAPTIRMRLRSLFYWRTLCFSVFLFLASIRPLFSMINVLWASLAVVVLLATSAILSFWHRVTPPLFDYSSERSNGNEFVGGEKGPQKSLKERISNALFASSTILSVGESFYSLFTYVWIFSKIPQATWTNILAMPFFLIHSVIYVVIFTMSFKSSVLIQYKREVWFVIAFVFALVLWIGLPFATCYSDAVNVFRCVLDTIFVGAASASGIPVMLEMKFGWRKLLVWLSAFLMGIRLYTHQSGLLATSSESKGASTPGELLSPDGLTSGTGRSLDPMASPSDVDGAELTFLNNMLGRGKVEHSLKTGNVSAGSSVIDPISNEVFSGSGYSQDVMATLKTDGIEFVNVDQKWYDGLEVTQRRSLALPIMDKSRMLVLLGGLGSRFGNIDLGKDWTWVMSTVRSGLIDHSDLSNFYRWWMVSRAVMNKTQKQKVSLGYLDLSQNMRGVVEIVKNEMEALSDCCIKRRQNNPPPFLDIEFNILVYKLHRKIGRVLGPAKNKDVLKDLAEPIKKGIELVMGRIERLEKLTKLCYISLWVSGAKGLIGRICDYMSGESLANGEPVHQQAVEFKSLVDELQSWVNGTDTSLVGPKYADYIKERLGILDDILQGFDDTHDRTLIVNLDEVAHNRQESTELAFEFQRLGKGVKKWNEDYTNMSGYWKDIESGISRIHDGCKTISRNIQHRQGAGLSRIVRDINEALFEKFSNDFLAKDGLQTKWNGSIHEIDWDKMKYPVVLLTRLSEALNYYIITNHEIDKN
jgi:hypothetical protein